MRKTLTACALALAMSTPAFACPEGYQEIGKGCFNTKTLAQLLPCGQAKPGELCTGAPAAPTFAQARAQLEEENRLANKSMQALANSGHMACLADYHQFAIDENFRRWHDSIRRTGGPREIDTRTLRTYNGADALAYCRITDTERPAAIEFMFNALDIEVRQ